MNSFQSLITQFGIEYPIIQAPMAGISTPALAAAVSNAGGMGSLGIGASTASQAKKMIEETRSLTSRPFNVNVFCHHPAQRDEAREKAWLHYLEPLFQEYGVQAPAKLDEIYKSFLAEEDVFHMLLEQQPAVVSFHFGIPPGRQIAALKNAGIQTMATATNLHEAAMIEASGMDTIVAQGIEAGGHRGIFDPHAPDERWSTAVLVRMLSRQTKLPVIAAGGIMDGKGIRAMLDLGASGVQLGTAFLLCPESAANENYRKNLKSDRATMTKLTSVFSGRPARGIVNRLVTYGEAEGSPPPPSYPIAYDAAKRLHAAASKQGNHEFAAQWAGQGAPLIRELPAAELVSQLVEEWDKNLLAPRDSHS